MPASPTMPNTTAGATGRSGLSEDAAGLRLLADGRNILPGQARHGLLALAWEVIQEPMFLLLVAAGALYLMMGDPGDAAMLLGFVVVVEVLKALRRRRIALSYGRRHPLSSEQSPT